MNSHSIADYTPLASGLDSLYLDARQAQSLIRMVEAAPMVVGRPQFFMWMQGHVQQLLPHSVSVCGAYSRQRRQLQFNVFNSVVLPSSLIDLMSAESSPLIDRIVRHWVEGGCRAFSAPVQGEASPWKGLDVCSHFEIHELNHMLVHAVSRPDRPHELETLFLLLQTHTYSTVQTMELVIAQLHATYVRAVGTAPNASPAAAGLQPRETFRSTSPVTSRELQILHWVREGKSNHDIAAQLDISALTVKNHIHKILRKLGANNRAHAVTLVIRLGLLPGQPPRGGNVA